MWDPLKVRITKYYMGYTVVKRKVYIMSDVEIAIHNASIRLCQV